MALRKDEDKENSHLFVYYSCWLQMRNLPFLFNMHLSGNQIDVSGKTEMTLGKDLDDAWEIRPGQRGFCHSFVLFETL
jgi:hypothetical protein